VREIGFATAFSFKYSRRPGTPAAALRKQVAEDVKSARLEALQDLIARQQHAFDDRQIGRTLPALFEKPGRKAGQLVGRTPYLQPVHVDGQPTLIGSLASVRVERRTANSLHGTLV
jgi:tRNA-2-methylthio-N6-dimethylallyladenosine synthase